VKKANRIGVAVLLLGLSAFAVRSGEPDANLPIWKADEEFSRVTREKGLAGFLSFIAEDFQTVRPNSPLIGKKEFGEGWSKLLNDPATKISWKPLLAKMSKSGDLGYTVGSYEITRTDEKGTHPAGAGKYVTIWRKQKDGSWKVVLDTGVQDQQPQPPKP
jgi:ketosteroid isomerase-like protein